MSAVYGARQESDVVGIALFFRCTIPITPGKPECVKPRARAEPGEPQALAQVSCNPFRFRMDSLLPMTMV